MTFQDFLQLLNLPMVAGLAWLVFQSGRVVAMLEDHERRLGELEQHASWQRRQVDRSR